MTRSGVQLFGIETVDDYLTLCGEAVHDLACQQESVLKGFTAIVTLNHVPDWLRYKLSSEERQRLGLPTQPKDAPVFDFFEAQNHDLKLIRQIANGFKHLRPTHSTEKVEGYDLGPFGVGPFGAPYLLTDLGDHIALSDRWVVGLDLCERVLAWWQNTLAPMVAMEGS